MSRLSTKGLRELEFMGVDVKQLIKVYSPQQLAAAAIILEHFPLYKPLTDYFKQYKQDIIDDRMERSLAIQNRVSSHRKKQATRKRLEESGRLKPEEIVEPRPANTILGLCPRCGEPLGGLPVPPCETKNTGRIFLKECTSCTYYSELFKDGKTFTEKEGG